MLDRIYTYRLADMNEAVQRYRMGRALQPRRQHKMMPEHLIPFITRTPDVEMEKMLAEADALIDQAIILDPRLARKTAWRLSEEGIDGCPALIASGEERCYFDRRRVRLADDATTEPIRVVISTDSKQVNRNNAVAFIAAAKLAQQFRPLELWWQGAWLKDNERSAEYGYGHIFHVPLIQGDLDFSRLVFVLSSPYRDHVSYRIMFSYAYTAGYGWGGGTARYSHLEKTDDFVSETGIVADPRHIAEYAARWAGMEPLYRIRIDDYEAQQFWRPAPGPSETPAYTPTRETAAERKERERRWREADEAERRRKRAAAEARVGNE